MSHASYLLSQYVRAALVSFARAAQIRKKTTIFTKTESTIRVILAWPACYAMRCEEGLGGRGLILVVF